MAELFDVSKGKKNSVKDFVLDKFSSRHETMSELYRSWMLNLAWVRGYQNTDFDSSNRTFRTPSAKHPWKARLVSNLMLPIVRRNVSQLVHNTNVWDVIPATADQEDLNISQTAKKLLLAYWDILDMPQKLLRVAFWQSVCSSAFLKVGWDTQAGDEVSIQSQDVEAETLRNFLQLQGFTETPKELKVREGDAFIDVVTPFNMLFDPNANIMEESMWSVESQIKSKDWVIDTYGNKWKDLTETDSQELFLYPFIHGERTGKLPTKGILVHEFNAVRSRKHKNGIHAIMSSDGQMLKTPQDMPYDHGELPYTHFLEIYDPASLWGTNAAEQVRPHQARYNRVQSAVLENININTNIQWLNARQSTIKQFTNKPGQVYNYNHPFKPEQTTIKPLPAYLDRFLDRTRLDMQDTASTHDVSEAKAEPGIRSGKAVLALQDADDSVKGPVLLWFDKGVAKTGKQLLQILSVKISDERLIEVRGTFSEQETLSFKGGDLKGKSRGNYFKVRTKTYGRQPLSRAGREGLVETLINLQLLHPQIHREELLHLIGAADVLSIYDENSNDRLRQHEEIKQLMEQQEVGVYFGQNHDVHISSIKKFIASNQWDELEPQIKEAISQHLRNHLEQQTIELIYQQAFASGMMGGQNEGRGSQGRGSQGRTGSQGQGGRSQTGAQATS